MYPERDAPRSELPASFKPYDEEFLALLWVQDTLRAVERLPSSKRKSNLLKQLLSVQEDTSYLPNLEKSEQMARDAAARIKTLECELVDLNKSNDRMKQLLLDHKILKPAGLVSNRQFKPIDTKARKWFWILVIVVLWVATAIWYFNSFSF